MANPLKTNEIVMDDSFSMMSSATLLSRGNSRPSTRGGAGSKPGSAVGRSRERLSKTLFEEKERPAVQSLAALQRAQMRSREKLINKEGSRDALRASREGSQSTSRPGSRGQPMVKSSSRLGKYAEGER